MSKRFGRKQKRRLKARIESLEDTCKAHHANAVKHKRDADYHKQLILQWDREISVLLGSHSALRPASLMRDVTRRTRNRAVGGGPPRDYRNGGAVRQNLEFAYENMHNFLIKVDRHEDYEGVRRLIRVLEQDKQTGETCLSISESQYRRCGFTERDIRHLVGMVNTEMGVSS